MCNSISRKKAIESNKLTKFSAYYCNDCYSEGGGCVIRGCNIPVFCPLQDNAECNWIIIEDSTPPNVDESIQDGLDKAMQVPLDIDPGRKVSNVT